MSLEIKTVKELPPAVRKMYDRASQAKDQRNFGYASEMLHMVLHAQPGFEEGHQILQTMLLDKVGGKPSAVRSMVGLFSTFVPIQVKGPMLLKQGKALQALELAEKALDADPTSPTTLRFLAKAASDSGLPSIAIQALATAVRLYPNNVPILTELSQAYAANDEFQQALSTWQQVKQINPNDMAVDTELKRLVTLAAMQDGKWEQAKSSRDLIKNKDQAQLLEQQSRVGSKDVAALQNQIRSAEQLVAKQETNANLISLAGLYRRNKQYEKALATYQRSIDVSGVLDPSIEESMTEISCTIFDDKMAALAGQAGQEAAIAEFQQQRNEMLLKRLITRVERYPNDANYRFDLGEMYWRLNNFDQAMQEFQSAQKSPQYRVRTLAYMGKCMLKKNLPELALEQFKLALEGLDKNDPIRKDALYQIGCTCEEINRPDDALAAFRELYSVDVNYLDVGDRLQKFYKKG